MSTTEMTGYQNVLVLGGSQNIGYLSAMRMLGLGSTVTFLLRNPSVFDGNAEVEPYMRSGLASLVKGDALNKDNIKAAWESASAYGAVDVVIFAIGATKATINVCKGIVITPGNLVTQCLLNLLCAIPSTASPKIVTISSIGVTPTSHKHLPSALKPLYGWALAGPHRDKLGAERLVAHCAGWTWNSQDDGEPEDDIMGENWRNREGLPKPGSLRNILVIRPAMLTNGECKGDSISVHGTKKPYRLSDGEITGWTISRKDVAHFLVNAVTSRWSEYSNKHMSIVY